MLVQQLLEQIGDKILGEEYTYIAIVIVKYSIH